MHACTWKWTLKQSVCVCVCARILVGPVRWAECEQSHEHSTHQSHSPFASSCLQHYQTSLWVTAHAVVILQTPFTVFICHDVALCDVLSFFAWFIHGFGHHSDTFLVLQHDGRTHWPIHGNPPGMQSCTLAPLFVSLSLSSYAFHYSLSLSLSLSSYAFYESHVLLNLDVK